jgi:hypothetical protein
MDKENVCIYTMEDYSAIKNEIRSFTGKWMELEIIMLSEKTEKDKHHICRIYT